MRILKIVSFSLDHKKIQLRYCFKDRKWNLNHEKITFLVKIKSSEPKSCSINHHFIRSSIYFCAIIKLDAVDSPTYNFRMVNTHRKRGFDSSINFISSTQHVVVSNCWMVTNLLKINRTAIDPTLISLP